MRQEPYIAVDLHGMTSEQAIERINLLVKRANPSTYRIRIVMDLIEGILFRERFTENLDMDKILKY